MLLDEGVGYLICTTENTEGVLLNPYGFNRDTASDSLMLSMPRLVWRLVWRDRSLEVTAVTVKPLQALRFTCTSVSRFLRSVGFRHGCYRLKRYSAFAAVERR